MRENGRAQLAYRVFTGRQRYQFERGRSNPRARRPEVGERSQSVENTARPVRMAVVRPTNQRVRLGEDGCAQQ